MSLESRKKMLRERNVNIKDKKIPLTRKSRSVNQEWVAKKKKYREPKSGVPFFKTLIFSFLFLIISIITSFIVFFLGVDKNISSDKIDIAIEGPTSITSGDETQFSIIITNKNPVQIVVADLIVNYPDGSRDSENPNKELIRTRKGLGNIPIGSSKKEVISPILFGSTGETKDLEIELEYIVEGSQSQFSTKQTKSLFIKSSPVSITISGADNIVSGKETEFLLTIFSNSSKTLNNLFIKKRYPPKFIQTYSSQEEVATQDGWVIRDLKPNDRKQIRIGGIFVGSSGDEQTLRFDVLANQERGKDIELATVSKLVEIESPLIEVALSLNNSNEDLLNVNSGSSISGTLKWENKSDKKLNDLRFIVSIEGNGFRRDSVLPERGEYDLIKEEIQWDQFTDDNLSDVSSKDSGSYDFEFDILQKNPLLDLENKFVNLSLDFSVKSSENIERDEVSRKILNKRIKVRSDLDLLPLTKYATSKIENTGPIPPKLGEQTTYSLSFVIQNNGNDVRDVEVSIPLRSYVSWIGSLVPSFANVSYIDQKREVLWRVGGLRATGINATKDIEFRVGYIPITTHISNTPDLTGPIVLSYTDAYTNEQVEKIIPPVNIELIGEPFNFQAGQVVR